jgi:galactokinase
MIAGEHIDYALFGVLPAAIERDILIACAPREVPSVPSTTETHHAPGSVVVDNLHPNYSRQIFAPAPKPKSSDTDEEVHVEGWHLDINTQQLRWESYVKAGYYVGCPPSCDNLMLNIVVQGVLEEYFKNSAAHPIPVDLLVTGTVPAGSGLSSSAAMVVASTLAFLAINGKVSLHECSPSCA